MAKFEDLTGQVFGELTVIERAQNYILPCGKQQTMWKCKCSCGKIFITRALQLKNGESKSCGHLQKEIVSKLAKEQKACKNTWDLSGNFGIGYDQLGNKFYFDKEDFDLIKDYYWSINGQGYVVARPNKKTLMLHRLIMNVNNQDWKKVQVDHICGKESRYDNRKSNLRLATVSQNGMNKNLLPSNKTGVTGVSWHKGANKWRSRIKVDGKELHLGLFENFEDAVKARKEAEEKYFGEYSFDNSQKIKK